MFDSDGYQFRYVQRNPCRKEDAHVCTYVFTFYASHTGVHYVVNADEHYHNVYAVKFYAKHQRHHENRYQLLTNRGHVGRILQTLVDIVRYILQMDNRASFAMIGMRSIDAELEIIEPPQPSQRYRLYRAFIGRKFGSVLFEHFEVERVNAYALINRTAHDDVPQAAKEITRMFTATYANLEF